MTLKKTDTDPTTLPTSTKGIARTPRIHPWAALGAEMLKSPGAWYEYDGFDAYEPKKSPIRMYAKRINEGKLLTLSDLGNFEAVAKGRILYLRFLG